MERDNHDTIGERIFKCVDCEIEIFKYVPILTDIFIRNLNFSKYTIKS